MEEEAEARKELIHSSDERYMTTMLNVVGSMSVSDRRNIFQRLLNDGDENMFFPSFGMTAGHFALFYALTRKTKTRKKP